MPDQSLNTPNASAPAFEVKGLFDLTPCGLVVCDASGRILRANALFQELTGLDAVGRRLADLLTRPSQFILAAKVLPQLNLTGAVREVAIDLAGPDGVPLAVLINANTGTGANGPVHYFALFPARGRREFEQEFLQAKQDLRQSRDYLQLAEKLAQVGHWRVDLTTHACYWSPEIYQIYGIDPSTYEPVMNGTIDFYHPDDRDEIRTLIADALERKSDFTFRKRLIQNRTGDIRWVQSHGICECDPNGKIVALFGVFQDVTDTVRAQEAITQSEARYRLLADHANDIITVFGLTGDFQYLSPAITKVLGYAPDELIGRNVRDIIHADDYPITQAAYQAYVTGKDWDQAPRIQYRARHKDGHFVWAEAHPTAVVDDGRITAFQDVVRDISAQKATEDALDRARIEANAAAEAKAQFLATMSHELRTPLTSIIGFSALLRDLLAGDDSLAKHSQRIYSAGQGLLGLINDILDHSKLEAGQLELDLAPCDVTDVAHDIADLLTVQAGAKGLALVVQADADLPPALMLDDGRLRQILLNLVGNAIKFTAKGSVILSIAVKAGEGGERLHVSVCDTGVGISEVGLAQLFQRFSQVDHNRDGTGLGLMICKQLVELMGGTIGVESREGEGSNFWFDIPVARADMSLDACDISVPPSRLLVVDDQDDIRNLLRSLLEPCGHSVDLCANGAEAVEACRSQVYDLIFMDLNMPVLDGLDATRAIRAETINAGTPIVAVTAAGPERQQACTAAGMSDFLPKPVSAQALRRTVADWLSLDTASDLQRFA